MAKMGTAKSMHGFEGASNGDEKEDDMKGHKNPNCEMPNTSMNSNRCGGNVELQGELRSGLRGQPLDGPRGEAMDEE